MSWRAARCRITCHVRSLPPLSSGSSSPAFSQSSFMPCALQRLRGVRQRRDARAGSVCTPSPSMNVRYQSSRFSRLQSASPPSAVPAACAVDQRRDRARVGDAALRARAIEQHVARQTVASGRAATARTAPGIPSSCGVRISAGRIDLHRLAQDPLGREAAQFHPWRQRGRELHEVVIEEGHAALDRGRHAHLVLLHQQFHQVRLQVRVEQPVERACCCPFGASK